MTTLRTSTVLVPLVLTLVGCGSDKGFESRDVSREDYGARWPLLVDEATLVCDPGGAPTFQVDGAAWGPQSAATSQPQRLAAIWADDPDRPGTKLDLDVLLDDALDLCD